MAVTSGPVPGQLAPAPHYLIGRLQVDFLDAGLGEAARTGVPGAVADGPVLELRQPQAAPFPLRRQALAALAAELVEERLDLPVGPPSQHVGAHLTPQAVVGRQDLPLVADGVRDHPVDIDLALCLGHAPAPPVAPMQP